MQRQGHNRSAATQVITSNQAVQASAASHPCRTPRRTSSQSGPANGDYRDTSGGIAVVQHEGDLNTESADAGVIRHMPTASQ